MGELNRKMRSQYSHGGEGGKGDAVQKDKMGLGLVKAILKWTLQQSDRL